MTPKETHDDFAACKICNDIVHMDDFREHAAEHNPNAMNVPYLSLLEIFTVE